MAIPIIAPHELAGAPTEPGAYALLIWLERVFAGPIGALGAMRLGPGAYLYLGSARGPGGIRARLQRHVRMDKRPHWHVDHLTMSGNIVAMLAVPGGTECALADRARLLPGASTPAPGFGSSDCRRCPSHLVAVPGEGMDALAALADYSAASGRRT